MKKCIALVISLLLLSGCASVAREPDDLALVRVLGVDGGGRVTLTAVCGSDQQSGVLRGEATADSFEQARQSVVWSGDGKELSLTGVSYLLVGPDVELERVLFAILEDADLGASAAVWLVDGAAGKVLNVCKDPAADLELLTLEKIKAPTVAQAAAALTTEGWVELPCLVEQGGRLEERGTSRWKESN